MGDECGWDSHGGNTWSDCSADWFCAPYCANELKDTEQFKCLDHCMVTECNVNWKEDCPNGDEDPFQIEDGDKDEPTEETKPPSIAEEEKDNEVPLEKRDCDVSKTLRATSGVFTDG